jgi:dipeptidase E
MKLVFYSGGQNSSNHVLHEKLVSLSGSSKYKRMTYVPYCAEGSKPFFSRFCRRFKSFGVREFQSFPVDLRFTKTELRKALDSDILYLAGGNTFYFLDHLKKQKLLGVFRDYVKSGGIIAGLSAGGLILTPNIALAGYPKFEADENEVGLKNLEALGLVDFEFYPHFHKGKRLEKALCRYSAVKTKNPILAVQDGQGLILNGKNFQSTGPLSIFHAGKQIRL